MWTPEIDQRISDVVIEHLSHGKSQQQAFRVLSRELDASVSSIENRWYSHIKPLKEADINAARSAGVNPPQQIGPNPIIPPWKTTWLKPVDDLIAREIIAFVASGKTQTQAVAILSKTIPFDASAINTRWHNVLKPLHRKAIDEAKLSGQIVTLQKKIKTEKHKVQKLEDQLADLMSKPSNHIKGDNTP